MWFNLRVDFLVQPHSDLRLGEYLISQLSDQRWTDFRAAVAFAKRSGTQHLAPSLRAFDQRGSVRISVGIDLQGTSREGLEDLIQSVPNGQVWLFHNNNPSSTFHPKLYLFRNNAEGLIVVGSGNWTQGGLFTNYEATAAILLSSAVSEDAATLLAMEAVLDSWSQEQTGLCHRLTDDLLVQLVRSGYVRSEAQVNAAAAALAKPLPSEAGGTSGQAPSGSPRLFSSVAVPAAPRSRSRGMTAATVEPPEVSLEAGGVLGGASPVAAAGLAVMTLGASSHFVMTLQNTDVGVGQIRPGKKRRSPEVFIPLVALDVNPAFWKFPESFTPDRKWNAAHPQYRRNGLGKLDRRGVPMRIGTLQLVNMFFNPQKKDFRLRQETLRSSGHVGDIILVTALDPRSGYEYDVQVAPRGTPLFDELNQRCTVPVLNSQKFYGYF